MERLPGVHINVLRQILGLGLIAQQAGGGPEDVVQMRKRHIFELFEIGFTGEHLLVGLFQKLFYQLQHFLFAARPAVVQFAIPAVTYFAFLVD